MFPSVCSRAILFTLLFSTLFSIANAVPMELSHQGRLLDATDHPLSGTYTIIYSIHDAPVGGTQLWLEDHVGVVVTDGLFSVVLGGTVPLSADVLAGSVGGGGGATRYLQVQFSGQPPIMPRTQLVSTPYSIASSRVSGDVQTAPGELKVSAASDTKRIGIRVADSLAEASSIAIDEPGVQIALRITPDSTVFDQGQTSGDRVMVHAIHRGEDRISQTITPTTSSVAIKTKGTGAEANRSATLTVSASPGGSVSALSAVDIDGDDNPESEISQSVTPTTSSVAIKVKGTGADKDRRVGSLCDDSSAVHYLDVDEDGDGHAEARGIVVVKSSTGSGSLSASVSNQMTCDSDDDGVPDSEISQSVTPTTCGVAIKTKGTGAEANRSASVTATASPGGIASATSAVDLDGDDNPESEISHSVTPTTCGVAIKVKGTGAENNRTAGSTCDDSSAVNYLDVDDDGDGHAEGRGIISVKSASGTGATTAESRLTCDSDDDGTDDMSVVSTCDASQAKIVTDRDSGRSKARVGTTGTESSVAVEDDSDGDGLTERSVVCSVDPSRALVVVSEGDAEVSLTTRKGGMVNGAINISQGPALRVQLDGDGNGYLSNSLGIGATATHPIDVAGGAYCDGTNWVNASDKNAKENFQTVDGEQLLEKITDLDISRWNYKGDKVNSHIGPTAQDFKETFGVGSDGKSISTIDPSGIALAAIKELSKQNRELKDQNAKLMKQMEDLAKKVEKLTSGK